MFKAFENGNHGDHDLIVIDLGYSASRKSCGLFWSGQNDSIELQFGSAYAKVAEIVLNLKNPILVLEAVLSTCHAQNGNPMNRGDFENGRGWYYGAGVLTFAAALRFVRMLPDKLLVNDRPILLAEAFLSNKDTATGDGDDARLIHNQFWSVKPVSLYPAVESASPLVQGIPSVRVFTLP